MSFAAPRKPEPTPLSAPTSIGDQSFRVRVTRQEKRIIMECLSLPRGSGIPITEICNETLERLENAAIAYRKDPSVISKSPYQKYDEESKKIETATRFIMPEELYKAIFPKKLHPCLTNTISFLLKANLLEHQIFERSHNPMFKSDSELPVIVTHSSKATPSKTRPFESTPLRLPPISSPVPFGTHSPSLAFGGTALTPKRPVLTHTDASPLSTI